MTEPPGATATHRPPVMADVARLAGVSHQTVSRVINDLPNIRPATRARVEEAIRILGYRPNRAARALVTKRTATIGVIGTESSMWGPTTVHRTIEGAAREAGYFVSAVNLHTVSGSELAAAVDHLTAQDVEGIVVIAANDEALEVVRAQKTGLPLVVVQGDLSKARWTAGVDQDAGARMAVRHLLELGHTEIAHITGPLNWTEARARADGWRSELFAAGLRPGEPLVGDWTPESGYAAGLRIAELPGVTGVFAGNDQMAIGALRGLWEAGRRVPEEISVVGFDDIPEAAFLIPPLTTVRQDFAAVGRRAIEVMQDAIGGASEEDRLTHLIKPELVVRTSTMQAPDRSR